MWLSKQKKFNIDKIDFIKELILGYVDFNPDISSSLIKERLSRPHQKLIIEDKISAPMYYSPKSDCVYIDKKFYKENVAKKWIIKKNFILSGLIHETLHMASSERKGSKTYVGVKVSREENRTGLNEGMTQVINYEVLEFLKKESESNKKGILKYADDLGLDISNIDFTELLEFEEKEGGYYSQRLGARLLKAACGDQVFYNSFFKNSKDLEKAVSNLSGSKKTYARINASMNYYNNSRKYIIKNSKELTNSIRYKYGLNLLDDFEQHFIEDIILNVVLPASDVYGKNFIDTRLKNELRDLYPQVRNYMNSYQDLINRNIRKKDLTNNNKTLENTDKVFKSTSKENVKSKRNIVFDNKMNMFIKYNHELVEITDEVIKQEVIGSIYRKKLKENDYLQIKKLLLKKINDNDFTYYVNFKEKNKKLLHEQILTTYFIADEYRKLGYELNATNSIKMAKEEKSNTIDMNIPISKKRMI